MVGSIWSGYWEQWLKLTKLRNEVAKSGKPVVVARQSEPKNNDGRAECWWCGARTEKRPGFTVIYDICPKYEK